MKYAYAAVFTQEDNLFSVNFPDFESCYTSGENLLEALEMAKDVLCLTLYDMEEEGQTIPEPSAINDVSIPENSFASYVECDTLEYRKFYQNQSVKKTLTIPSWLNVMAEKANINFSATLQQALKQELDVS